jgi:hypothetical protein
MRRKLHITALILLVFSCFTCGQSNYTFGAKAGVSLANQGYKFTPIDYTLETEAIVGPVFSIFIEAFRAAHFSFQLDISYALKGSRSRIQSVTVNHLENDQITVNEGEETRSTFKYLSLAPMARYRFGQGSLTPFILLGPRIDILLDYSTNSAYPLNDQNKTIVGLTIGAGLEYKLQGLGLFTELQYQGDFYPVTGRDPLLLNNHMISLTLGLRYFVSD